MLVVHYLPRSAFAWAQKILIECKLIINLISTEKIPHQIFLQMIFSQNEVRNELVGKVFNWKRTGKLSMSAEEKLRRIITRKILSKHGSVIKLRSRKPLDAQRHFFMRDKLKIINHVADINFFHFSLFILN